MLHDRRAFQVVEVDSAEVLAEKLTQHTWCECCGFQLGDLLFLNDSSSGDGAQEYGVVRERRQIESITFGWCDEAKALDYIQQLQAGTLGEPFAIIANLIETPPAHGQCRYCA